MSGIAPSTRGYEQHNPRTPQEIVERLAGATTYREPLGSFGGLPSLTNDEIDFALATAGDKDGVRHSRLARALAYSVATQTSRQWPEVHEYGVPHLVRACGESRAHRALIASDGRVRVRVVLWDAFRTLLGRRVMRVDSRARIAHMRRINYVALYDFVLAEIRMLSETVCADAVETLHKG